MQPFTTPGHAFRLPPSAFRRVALAAIAGLASSCTSDAPTAARANDFVVCHQAGSGALNLGIAAADLATHLGHGDYISLLHVNQSSDAGDASRFRRITDAIAAARSARAARQETVTSSCRITISVAAGTYRGAFAAADDPAVERFPLLLDFPNVSLVGALAMETDAAGRPTEADLGPSTILAPVRGMVNAPLPEVLVIVNGHPGGSFGHNVQIQGFSMRSGHVGVDSDTGGTGIMSVRVKDLVVRGNRFEPRLSSAIDLRASSAIVDLNYAIGGTLCDFCLAGPGDYLVNYNRIAAGGIDGIVVTPLVVLPLPAGVETWTLPASASVTAQLVGNEIRDHLRKPVGVALRVATLGQGGPNVPQSSQVEFRNNILTNNTFAIMLEAGFPVANALMKSDLDATLRGNVITRSCQSDLLVAFTRHAAAIGVATRPYIRNSSFTLDLGADAGTKWSDAWFANPAGVGNELTVDGAIMPAGTRVAYDAARTCTPVFAN